MSWFRAKALTALAPMTLLAACVASPVIAPDAVGRSILENSTPRDGSTVKGPVDRLELRFSPPARLVEVTVTGADGMQTPMMITAVGEVASYSIPLPGLEPDVYTVGWRATAAGSPHQGSVRFTVR